MASQPPEKQFMRISTELVNLEKKSNEEEFDPPPIQYQLSKIDEEGKKKLKFKKFSDSFYNLFSINELFRLNCPDFEARISHLENEQKEEFLKRYIRYYLTRSQNDYSEKQIEFQHYYQCDFIAISPDSSKYAIACHDCSIQVFDLTTQKELFSPLRVHSKRIKFMKFSYDSLYLGTLGSDNLLLIWSTFTSTSRLILELHPSPPLLTFALTSSSFSSSAPLPSTFHPPSSFVPHSFPPPSTFPPPPPSSFPQPLSFPHSPSSILHRPSASPPPPPPSFNPSSLLLVVASSDLSISVLDELGIELLSISKTHRKRILIIEISRRRELVSISEDGWIRIWSLMNGDLLADFRDFPGIPYFCSFDEKIMVVGGGRKREEGEGGWVGRWKRRKGGWELERIIKMGRKVVGGVKMEGKEKANGKGGGGRREGGVVMMGEGIVWGWEKNGELRKIGQVSEEDRVVGYMPGIFYFSGLNRIIQAREDIWDTWLRKKEKKEEIPGEIESTPKKKFIAVTSELPTIKKQSSFKSGYLAPKSAFQFSRTLLTRKSSFESINFLQIMDKGPPTSSIYQSDDLLNKRDSKKNEITEKSQMKPKKNIFELHDTQTDSPTKRTEQIENQKDSTKINFEPKEIKKESNQPLCIPAEIQFNSEEKKVADEKDINSFHSIKHFPLKYPFLTELGIKCGEDRFPIFAGRNKLVMSVDRRRVMVFGKRSGFVIGNTEEVNNFQITVICMNQAETLLAVGNDGGELAFWKFGNLSQSIGPLSKYHTPLTSIAFPLLFTDPRMAFSDKQGRILIWHLGSKTLIGELHTNISIEKITWGEESRIYWGDQEGNVGVWDASFDKALLFNKKHENKVTSIYYPPSTSLLLTAALSSTSTSSSSIIIWRTPSGELVSQFQVIPLPSLQHKPESICSLLLFNNNLFAGTSTGFIHIWSTSTVKPLLGPLKGHFSHVFSLSFNEKEGLLESRSIDCLKKWKISMLSVKRMKVGKVFDVDRAGQLVAVKMCGGLGVVNVDNNSLIQLCFKKQNGLRGGLAFKSPDNEKSLAFKIWLGLVCRRAFKIWSAILLLPPSPSAVCFSASSTLLLSIASSTLTVWDLNSGLVLRKISRIGLSLGAFANLSDKIVICTDSDVEILEIRREKEKSEIRKEMIVGGKMANGKEEEGKRMDELKEEENKEEGIGQRIIGHLEGGGKEIEWDEKDKRILVLDGSRTVYILDVKRKSIVLKLPHTYFFSVHFSTRFKHCISALSRDQIIFLDWRKNQNLFVLKTYQMSFFTPVGAEIERKEEGEGAWWRKKKEEGMTREALERRKEEKEIDKEGDNRKMEVIGGRKEEGSSKKMEERRGEWKGREGRRREGKWVMIEGDGEVTLWDSQLRRDFKVGLGFKWIKDVRLRGEGRMFWKETNKPDKLIYCPNIFNMEDVFFQHSWPLSQLYRAFMLNKEAIPSKEEVYEIACGKRGLIYPYFYTFLHIVVLTRDELFFSRVTSYLSPLSLPLSSFFSSSNPSSSSSQLPPNPSSFSLFSSSSSSSTSLFHSSSLLSPVFLLLLQPHKSLLLAFISYWLDHYSIKELYSLYGSKLFEFFNCKLLCRVLEVFKPDTSQVRSLLDSLFAAPLKFPSEFTAKKGIRKECYFVIKQPILTADQLEKKMRRREEGGREEEEGAVEEEGWWRFGRGEGGRQERGDAEENEEGGEGQEGGREEGRRVRRRKGGCARMMEGIRKEGWKFLRWVRRQMEGRREGVAEFVKVRCIYMPEIGDRGSEDGKRFLKMLTELEPTNPIFNNEVLKHIIKYKWWSYCRSHFFLEFLEFFAFLLLFVVQTCYIAVQRTMADPAHEDYVLATYVFDGIIIIYAIFRFSSEIIQLKTFGWSFYFFSFWNLIDSILLTLVFVTMVLDLLNCERVLTTEALLKLFSGITIFFVFVRFLSFARGIKGSSFMVRLVLQGIVDIKYFLSIIIIFIFGLSLTAFEIQSDYNFNYFKSFNTFVRQLLGDLSYFDEMESSFYLILYVLFLISSIVLTIVMLNLLIAIVSDTYSAVRGSEKLTRVYELCNLIYEIDYEEGGRWREKEGKRRNKEEKRRKGGKRMEREMIGQLEWKNKGEERRVGKRRDEGRIVVVVEGEKRGEENL